MKEVTLKCLYIGEDAWKYLRNEMSVQRSGREMTAEKLSKWFNRYQLNHKAKTDGYVMIDDDSFGGCVGEPTENAYFEGRWTRWDIHTIKKMLDAEGYTYIDAPDRSCIYV